MIRLGKQFLGSHHNGMNDVTKLICMGTKLMERFEGANREQLSAVRNQHTLSRKWLTDLWLEEKKRGRFKYHRERSINKSTTKKFPAGKSFLSSFRSLFNVGPVFTNPELQVQPSEQEIPTMHMPPPSQPLTGALSPKSPDEVKIASVLARANLIITRKIEWANLMFSFEQENRYAIVDPTHPQTPVGFILEQSNVFMRQLLRTRRYFVAYMTDAMGNVLFRVRRPPWLINSTIYVEIDGKEVGVVHRRWHLWRRIYDLYLGNKQFAYVENAGFWNWTFTLQGENGEILAEIDRDWRGFGFEMFTDAGQYVIRFGDVDPTSKTGLTTQIQELEVARPLTLLERAVTLALAVSLDNDYFSRHSGWGIPFFPIYAGGE
eukprot:TRINITY_DN1596_c0_g1_i2.p1 TRINITY_DN1596_c0_g1~~TRINITY_DN1596_c0_g1_i2.p1  ORF type:complete len:376 (+),score=62.96 TRINITY_DN1596_c0_g1_i2:246-1373(+)